MTLPVPGTGDTYTQGLIDGIRNGVSAGWVDGGGTNTYTFDTSVSTAFRIKFSDGGSPTFAFSNPVDGRTVILHINMAATALTTVTWPTVYWPYGVPVIQPNVITTLVLRYDSTLSAWVCVSVSGPRRRTVLNPSVVHLNEYPTAIDASFETHEIINTGGSNITVSTPTNPVDDQVLRIMYYRSGTQTITWPSKFRWDSNTAPAAPTAATRNYYTFRFKASSGLWYESAGRVNNVPNA